MKYDKILSKQDIDFYHLKYKFDFGGAGVYQNDKDTIILQPIKDQKELYKKVIQYQNNK